MATGPDSCRVAVSGELDLVTADEVRQALQTAVGDNRVVVIDLGGLTFCDCSGLNALLAAARTARAGDVELRLCAVPHFLARILHLSGTRSAFTIDSKPGQPESRPGASGFS
ncbi:STAS domain-containing protein [Streptomyces sp. OE57]|uniref:STAS domain-containing protein n=1 Tax=Streptomyces lacaronensis TaxID=3379885 RepID=UPI0039B77D97